MVDLFPLCHHPEILTSRYETYCTTCFEVILTPTYSEPIATHKTLPTCVMVKHSTPTYISSMTNEQRTKYTLKKQFMQLARTLATPHIISKALTIYEELDIQARSQHRRALMLATLLYSASKENLTILTPPEILESYQISEAHLLEAKREIFRKMPPLPLEISPLPLLAQEYKLPKNLQPEVAKIYELAQKQHIFMDHSPHTAICATIFLWTQLYQIDSPPPPPSQTIKRCAIHLLQNLDKLFLIRP